MLHLLGKKIDLDNSKVVFQDNFSDTDIAKNWEIGRGHWHVNNGWLEGKHLESSGGLIYSRQSFDCNVLMDFEARTVPPSSHDLNFTWCADGWDKATDDVGVGYIAGLGGWYENKTGIERAPEFKLCSLTHAFQLEAGRTYRIQTGSIDGHCFIFVDGKIVIEVFDPDPIDTSKYGRLGFGVYASHVQFRDLKVYDVQWSEWAQSY
ncbi:MAG: hypothetical protein FWD03_03825 [Defluviitaleaceae bacterium]|nr:hypothetical protein [Defluviitaleaceae bacterium]